MAVSGSYVRGDEPRSVPDEDAEAYARAMAEQRRLNDLHDALTIQQDWPLGDPRIPENNPDPPLVGHPSVAGSLIPVWGSGREAIADYQEGHPIVGTINAGLAISDAVPLKALIGGLAKGGLRTAGPFAWRVANEYRRDATELGMRKWLGKQGFLTKGQPGHHWALPQKMNVPDWIKNQPVFIKGMRDAEEHGRIHGRYKGQPQYGPLERFWRGTPDWWKALTVSVPGHLGTAASIPGRN